MDKAPTLKYSVNKLLDSLTITNKSTKNRQRSASVAVDQQQLQQLQQRQQQQNDNTRGGDDSSTSTSSRSLRLRSSQPVNSERKSKLESRDSIDTKNAISSTTAATVTATVTATATTTTAIRAIATTQADNELTIKRENIGQMHGKLLDDDGCEATPKKGKSDKIKNKLYKESKFTERLRRSFRRTEQNSYEAKRSDKSAEKSSGHQKIATNILKPLQQQLKNSASIFSLTANLPGLSGHINPALLLDSPDQESTPPEYSYRHLNSVATTNSSTSLESNVCDSPTKTFSYWAWHINQSNNMGNEITGGIANVGTSAAKPLIKSNNTRELSGANNLKQETMTTSRTVTEERSFASGKENIIVVTTSATSAISTVKSWTAVTECSRSCSTTSDSSSTAAKLTRLQHFLSSKSSNESSKSYQGHSNEGFTISSFNSSSSEWENVYAFSSTTPNLTIEEDEEFKEFTLSEDPPKKLDSVAEINGSEAGTYYQYTLASPSNPFLPEITARTYHSTYEDMNEFRELEEELDANVTSVKYRIGSHSAQMPTPNYSRAGSQESTHSDGGTPYTYNESSGGGIGGVSNQVLSSASSTPGRHKRKLFSLSTPNKLNFPQQQYQQRFLQQQQQQQQQQLQHQQQQQQLLQSSPSPSPIALTTGNTTETYASSSSRKSSTSSTSLGRTLNPFISNATQPPPKRTSSATCLNKRTRPPLKQAAIITSPVANVPPLTITTANVAKDVNARREEFLRATMQICLVVSPPSTRLQLKSKSLTHLDGLQTEMICNHAKNTNNISSSEYFSVSFCTESGCQEEEFFAATKGVTLAIALSQALRRRNLSLSKLIITDTNDNNRITNILETGSTTVYNALDENIDVECLAGHHLIVTDKEGSRKTLQKANSFSSRVRPPRLLSSASTDESCDPNLTGNKQVKQRWSGLFGVKNPQQAQLCELLNNYTKNGVPQTTITTYNFDHPEQEDALNYLDSIHKSWKDIVEYSRMTDAELRIQTAIWELVTTEVDYIHCLQTVTDLFLACLEAIQAEGLLQDIDQYRLFANIRDICEANLKFWTFYLYPMVSHSIISREHLHISFFQTGFVQFGQIFAPYKKYCAEQSSCQFYCKELNRTNSLFTSYLAWCESQKMCNRLRLADILVRPMQRLTKYSLLLAAIKKHLINVEEIEAIDLMLHTTENFVFSVNNHLTTRQENERLKGVMARIESYDVVDTNNEQLDRLIKQNSQMFDLCGPMKGCAPHHVRHLFMEGDHKYKDNHGKIDVHCFLLTDMLLVCKSIAKKGLGSLKIIRQPYLTDRLVVQHSHNVLLCVYLNEFQVATTAFSLHCNEAKNWYDAVKRAKMIYTRLKQCSVTNWDNTNVRYGGGSIISGSTLDSLGIKKSPMNSSICSHVTSANNSHSGSMEWNDSRIVSADFEKTNSLSSDEGCSYLGVHGFPVKVKPLTTTSPQKLKVNPTSSANSLGVQPTHHLGQSLPNLTLHHSHTNNTLAVPVSSGTTNHSGTILLSASHRGISYPPPSPTRVPLRRAMAFSSSIKNPPLLKTRNITSQSSINWHQIPATPTPTTTPQNTLLNQAISNTITTNIETTTSTSISTTATTTIASTNATTCYALVPTAFYTQSNINSNTNTQSMLHSNTDMTLNGVISISLRSDAENASLTDSTDI